MIITVGSVVMVSSQILTFSKIRGHLKEVYEIMLDLEAKAESTAQTPHCAPFTHQNLNAIILAKMARGENRG
jgi:hypothetical protein